MANSGYIKKIVKIKNKKERIFFYESQVLLVSMFYIYIIFWADKKNKVPQHIQ